MKVEVASTCAKASVRTYIFGCGATKTESIPATASKKGVITAKKAGKTKITVKSGKKKYTVTVTVTK